MKRIALLIVLGLGILFGAPSETNAQIKFPKIPKVKIPKIKPPKIKIPKPKIKIPKPVVKIPKPVIKIPKPIKDLGPIQIPNPIKNITDPIKISDPFKDIKIPDPIKKIGPINPIPDPFNPIKIPDPFKDIKIPDPIKKIGGNIEAELKRKTRQYEGMINRTVVEFERAVQATRRDFETLAQAIKDKDEKRAASLFQSIVRKNPFLQNMVTNAIKDNMQSVTVCGTVGASYGFGIEGGWGIAVNPRDLLNAEALTGSVIVDGTISGGIQAGAGVDIVVGFSTAHPNNLAGGGQGVGADFKVKAGGSASVSFDLYLTQFTGFSVGLGPGAEAGIKTQMSYTHVLKTFTTRPVEMRTNQPFPTPQYPTYDQPQPRVNPTQPNPYKNLNPNSVNPNLQTVHSSPKMLGVHSVTTQTNGNMFGQQITQVTFGSAAQRAGLETGDIILTVNGTPVQSQDALRQAIQSSGSQMFLKVVNVRNGQLVDIQVNF